MRNVAAAALLFSLGGCSEQIDETYATYADAQRAGAIQRGWIPAFVPASARHIADSHDLDTNRQVLQFTIPLKDTETMLSGLRRVPAHEKAAVKLSREHGLAAASEIYLVCSEPVSGALVVDGRRGRVVYDTTLDWTDDHCSDAGKIPD